eukprot:m.340317 g.340317  ORF g.340317 m.340317 type:complete len:569 (+) comp20592_c0_seq4:198-1904(+)
MSSGSLAEMGKGGAPSIRPSVPMSEQKSIIVRGAIAASVGVLMLYLVLSSGHWGGTDASKFKRISTDDMLISSWNMAAINNNPFEFWITHSDKAYNKMMLDVQDFIETPGSEDVRVDEVFTDAMLKELVLEMQKLKWDGIRETDELWNSDFRKRKIVSGFLKDKTLGDKRLASMPDRTTNTILTLDGPVYRPTVINCYNEVIKSQEDWWSKWSNFIFASSVRVADANGKSTTVPVSSLLIPISSAKYPALSKEEERISLPLQTMCGAIFDAILVHIVNKVQPKKWQGLRAEMCEALNLKKTQHTLGIIANSYGETDVFFLQEVAKQFIDKASSDKHLKGFKVVSPKELGSRDQNSVMLLNKATYDLETVEHLTDAVWDELKATGQKVPAATGDILAITVKDLQGFQYFLASFHGDTNGLATIPVLTAVHAVYAKLKHHHRFIFGLDANTYEFATPGKTQDVLEFGRAYVQLGLTSVWGDTPYPSNHTTFNARTYLQPQLNKAARKDELIEKGDVNPKDFILISPVDFTVDHMWKDNTGDLKYIENMVFPTLEFPSDHGILSGRLRVVA